VGHVTLICKELASNAMLDQCLGIGASGGPEEPGSEGLADQGPSCSVVTAHASVNLSQELFPLLFGYTSLEDAGSAFLVQFALVDFVGFRSSNDASCLSLVIG
jgi:hypothetical protein